MAERDDDIERQLVLTDLVNRVLDRGVTIVGQVTISVAGVDLVYLGLRLDVAAIESGGARHAERQLRPARPSSGPAE